MDVGAVVSEYGFPIVAAVGLGYFVYYVWKWVTTEIDPVIGEANSCLLYTSPSPRDLSTSRMPSSA